MITVDGTFTGPRKLRRARCRFVRKHNLKLPNCVAQQGFAMLGHPDVDTLLIVGLLMGAGGFFGGIAMNGVLEDSGFGVVGNMLILIAGAVVGMKLGAMVPLPFEAPVADAVRAITGAFLCLSLLAVAKNVLRRFGP